jgi:hypothetical protein
LVPNSKYFAPEKSVSCGKNCGSFGAVLRKKLCFFSCQQWLISDTRNNSLFINAKRGGNFAVWGYAPQCPEEVGFEGFPQLAMNGV